MRLSRLRVKNFRNLADIDIPLCPGAVIVGENRAGKSNLLHALRLVLDPSLPDSERSLQREDFWDGLSDGSVDWDPMGNLEEIEIIVEMADFGDDDTVLTVLADALIEGDPMVARVTYVYRPRPVADDLEEGSAGYEWRIFGGHSEEMMISRDMRRYLHMSFLGALRDVASDIRSWRRSPLRQLLDAVAEEASDADLEDIAHALQEANDQVTSFEPVKDLGNSITSVMREIAGDHHGLQTELGIVPPEPVRLLRNLRIFIDGPSHRGLESASLGALNVLYLALLELRLERRVKEGELAHIVMAIEEPEAHLHPHLQRLTFRRLLRQDVNERSIIVTTQSPHIASVTRPSSLIVLRFDGIKTSAAAAAKAPLNPDEWKDIERYLDVTRAELVFGRKVLLVEGFAEQVLLPRLATNLEMNLDQLGVTVCAIYGTHFSPYVALLEALDIPWAVLTDGDPTSSGKLRGRSRGKRILDRIDREGEELADAGIFIGGTTLEHDLMVSSTSNFEVMRDVLIELTRSQRARERAEAWTEPPEPEVLMKSVTAAGGKGRVAQRLALCDLAPTVAVADALQYLSDL